LFASGVNFALPVARRVYFLELLLEWAQMLGFPYVFGHGGRWGRRKYHHRATSACHLLALRRLNHSSSLPWHGTPLDGIAVALSYTSTSSLDAVHGMVAQTVGLTIAGVWIGVFVLLTVHIAANFIANAPQNETELRALRAIALLSTTTFFLPLTEITFRAFWCSPAPGSMWMDSGLGCESGGRVAIAVLLGLMLVVFVGMSLFVAAVFVERDPASDSWAAQSHGRVTVAVLLIKLLLAFLFNAVPDKFVGSGGMTVLLILLGLLWTYLMWRQMPYTHAHVNALQTGLALGFTWVSVCLGLAQLQPELDMWLLVVAVTPFMVLSGAMLSQWDQTRIASKPLRTLNTMFEVNAWARWRMQAYAKLAQSDEQKLPAKPTKQATLGDAEKGEVSAAHATHGTHGSHGTHGAGSKRDEQEVVDEERLALKKEAFEGYKQLTQRFGDKELAYILAASFYERHARYHVDEADALAHALRHSPALDSRFHIYRRGMALHESDGSGLSPIDRITFEQRLRTVGHLRVETYRTLAAVWKALADDTPDLSTVSEHATVLRANIDRIHKLYQRLLQLNGESPKVLRGYALFLLDMTNESARAQELLNKAERSEETWSRRIPVTKHLVFGRSQPARPAMDENAAFITISLYHTNLGEVLQVSQPALRLLGLTHKSQLQGQNINSVIPPPIRDAHSGMLAAFRHRQSGSIVDATRLLFMNHKDGSIFPVWMTTMESPPDEHTLEPRATALLTEVSCTEEVIVFGGADAEHCISCASAGALDLLGLTGETVESERPSMRHWFPSLEGGEVPSGATGVEAASSSTSETAHGPARSPSPRTVRLRPEHIAWLEKAVTRGELTTEQARAIGVHRSGLGAAAGAAPSFQRMSRASRHTNSVAFEGRQGPCITTIPMLQLTNAPGVIVLSNVSSAVSEADESDDETVVQAEQHSIDHLVQAPGSTLPGGAASQPHSLLFGRVQRVAMPALPLFYVLTFREMSTTAKDGGRDARADPDEEEGGEDSESAPGSESDSVCAHEDAERASPRRVVVSVDGSRGQGGPGVSGQRGDRFSYTHSLEVVGEGKLEEGVHTEGDEAAGALGAAGAVDTAGTLDPATSEMAHTQSRGSSKHTDVDERDEVLVTTFEAGKGVTSEVVQGYGNGRRLSQDNGGAHRGPAALLQLSAPRIVHSPSNGKGTTPLVSHRLPTATSAARRPRRGSATASHSSSSSTSSFDQLARALTTSRASREPEVLRARAVVLFLAVASIVLAVVVSAWVVDSAKRVQAVAEAVELAGVRSVIFAVSVARLAQLMSLNNGIDPHAIPLPYADIVSLMASNSEKLQTSAKLLYSMGPAGGPLAFSFEESSLVEVYDAASDATSPVPFQAALELAASFILKISTEPRNLTVWDPEVRSLTEMERVVTPVFTASIQRRHRDLADMAAATQTELLVGGLLIFVLLVAVTVSVLMSSIWSLGSRTDFVLSIFLLLPSRLARAIHARTSMSLEKVLGEAEEADSADSGGAQGGGGEPAEDGDEAARELLVEEQRREEEVEKALQHIAASNAALRPRQYRRSRWLLDQKSLRLTTPVLITLLFIAAVVIWRLVENGRTLEYSSRLVAFQRADASIVRYSMSTVTGLVGANVTARDYDRLHSILRGDAALAAVDVAVLGGTLDDGDFGQYPVSRLADTEPSYSVLVRDGCIGADHASSSSGRLCREIAGGVLTTGISPASRYFVGIGNRLVSNATSLAVDPPFTAREQVDLVALQASIVPIREAWDLAMSIVSDQIKSVSDTATSGITVLAILYAVVLVLISPLFLALADSLADPLRAAYHLLLVLPAPVVQQVAEVRNKYRSIITDVQLRNRSGL
jgi:hypothetical protein